MCILVSVNRHQNPKYGFHANLSSLLRWVLSHGQLGGLLLFSNFQTFSCVLNQPGNKKATTFFYSISNLAPKQVPIFDYLPQKKGIGIQREPKVIYIWLSSGMIIFQFFPPFHVVLLNLILKWACVSRKTGSLGVKKSSSSVWKFCDR